MPKGWIGKPTPKGMHISGRGWLSDVNRCYTDVTGTYAVMIRTLTTEWGKMEHAAIRNKTSTDISWREKQKIKNEIFGSERVAIEVFPSSSQLVDGANMYHLWVLPIGMKLPFTLKESEVLHRDNPHPEDMA